MIDIVDDTASSRPTAAAGRDAFVIVP